MLILVKKKKNAIIKLKKKKYISMLCISSTDNVILLSIYSHSVLSLSFSSNFVKKKKKKENLSSFTNQFWQGNFYSSMYF